MKTTTCNLHLLLLLSITLFIAGCVLFENEPKPISSSEETADIDIGEVIRSGEFEQRVETEQIPQNNCDGKSSFSFSVKRERTLEQSVELTLQGQGGGELEIAGKPLEVGAAGKIVTAISAEYGHRGVITFLDSGGMEFTIEPGDSPTYTIVWREKWEKGYVTIESDGQTTQVPYLYQTTARPEVVDIEYKDCETGQLAAKENIQSKIIEDLQPQSTDTSLPPPTYTPLPTHTPFPTNTSLPPSQPTVLPTNTSIPAVPQEQDNVTDQTSNTSSRCSFSIWSSETKIKKLQECCPVLLIDGSEGRVIDSLRWIELENTWTIAEPITYDQDLICSRRQDSQVRMFIGVTNSPSDDLPEIGLVTVNEAGSLIQSNSGKPMIIVPW